MIMVYGLYEAYDDFCTVHETLLDLYANEDHAITEQIQREQDNPDARTEYYVRSITVK